MASNSHALRTNIFALIWVNQLFGGFSVTSFKNLVLGYLSKTIHANPRINHYVSSRFVSATTLIHFLR